jgi:hypothetical protein
MTSAKEKSALEVRRNPNSSARAMCERNFAERISAFEGTQPVLRQSPPSLCFSISVTLAFTAAAM